MRRRIHVNDVRSGMYVQKVEGRCPDAEDWRSSLSLQQAATLSRLRAAGVETLWIDTEKGIDVPDVRRADSDEMARAVQIRDSGVKALARIMGDVRSGRTLDATELPRLIEDILGSVQRNRDALISVTRIKSCDDLIQQHSLAVSALMVLLALQLGLPADQVRLAACGGLLHDVGKTVLPEGLLNKPSKLSDSEFSIVRAHTAAGAALLQSNPEIPAEVIDVCLHHHERVDGTGYPGGLGGKQLSVLAKMCAVCDVYDALTSTRPYKQAWPRSEAISRMTEWAGTHFDEHIFHAFLRCLG